MQQEKCANKLIKYIENVLNVNVLKVIDHLNSFYKENGKAICLICQNLG